MLLFEIIPETAASIEIKKQSRGIYEYDFCCKLYTETVTVVTHFACINCFSVWQHSIGFDTRLKPEWNAAKCNSSILHGLPYQGMVDQDGKNIFAVSVSDAENRIEIKNGIREEDASVTCKIVFNISKKTDYKAVIRIDTRNIPYYEAVYSASKWWDSLGYKSCYVPKAAKMPMYSSWYSFHQQISVEEIIQECKLAKKLGMKTVILDDGWQTEDNRRGYSYCGDWEPAKSKTGDMAELVRNIHRSGMKIMLWYNIAFMGEKARNAEKFKGKYIGGNVKGRYTLDPRYKEVRNYLTDMFSKAVSKWKIDGVKIDFVDSFIRTEKDVITYEMDIPVLEDAVNNLIKSIYEKLKKVNSEVLVEFRQNYIGPFMRKYANIFRVADCPADALQNRIGVINLRLTSSETAVHSDMLMWNYEAPAFVAAKQIINVLFSVPQISVRIEKLTKEHYNMLEFYLKLWKKYKNNFLSKKIIPEKPEANYSKVSSLYKKTQVCICYGETTVFVDKKAETALIVNGTANEDFYIESEAAEVTVYNCTGKIVKSYSISKGLSVLKIPVSGTLELFIKRGN